MQPREHRVEFQLKLYLVFRRRLAVKARVYSRLGGWFQRERERETDFDGARRAVGLREKENE